MYPVRDGARQGEDDDDEQENPISLEFDCQPK